MTLRSRYQLLLTAFISVAALLNIAGCARGRSTDTAQSTATPAPTPATVTSNDLTFSPVARAGNTYRWQKESADSWKAVLTSAATDKAPAKEVVYRLDRWPPPRP